MPEVVYDPPWRAQPPRPLPAPAAARPAAAHRLGRCAGAAPCRDGPRRRRPCKTGDTDEPGDGPHSEPSAAATWPGPSVAAAGADAAAAAGADTDAITGADTDATTGADTDAATGADTAAGARGRSALAAAVAWAAARAVVVADPAVAAVAVAASGVSRDLAVAGLIIQDSSIVAVTRGSSRL